jgi:hypothetical protein
MKRKRYTDEQIAFPLRQAEIGTPVEEICRKLGSAQVTPLDPSGAELFPGRSAAAGSLHQAGIGASSDMP